MTAEETGRSYTTPWDTTRLDVKATLDAPRLTYAELGAWVQKASGVPIAVSFNIRERKATVLVEDRPLRETMDRVADALFLEWEPTERGGYTMRLKSKVAAEEAATLSTEARDRLAAVRETAGVLMDFSRLNEGEREAEVEQLKSDDSAAAKRRLAIWSGVADDASSLVAGELLAALSPAAREAIYAGGRIVGTTTGAPGTFGLSKRELASFDRMAASSREQGNGGSSFTLPALKPADGLVITLKGDPSEGRIHVMATTIAADGNALMGTGTEIGGENSDEPNGGPLDVRVAAWATKDEASLATPLNQDARPLAVHSSPRHTLADLLVALHHRTGLPIVADGFREAVPNTPPPDGVTVGAWLDSLRSGTQRTVGETRYAARTANGWLALRRLRYWDRLIVEPPERSVRAFEAASPSLESASVFAASLTPLQVEYLSTDQLVMDAPSAAVEGNVSFLRLWRSLPLGQRVRAMDKGLPLAALTSEGERRAVELLEDFENHEGLNGPLLASVLGRAQLPNDLTLFVAPNDDIERLDPTGYETNPLNELPSFERHWRGFEASVRSGEQLFVSRSVALWTKPPRSGPERL